MNLKRLYKNWFVHNCFGHPLMYFAAIFSVELSKLIHDSTLPQKKNKIDDGEDHY